VGSRRKKRRTHVKTEDEDVLNAPRSFIFKQGSVVDSVEALIDNLRMVMEPFTATRLQESRKNKLKDFVAVAGALGVTHFITFHQSDFGTNIRFTRTPRGPTLTFRAQSYCLVKDVLNSQKRPHTPGIEFQHSPLVVLNGFSGTEPFKQVLAAFFQNMFPAINVQKLKLKECRRVVIFNLEQSADAEDGEVNVDVDVRHYLITASPVELNRPLKKIVKAKIPRLGKLQDISDFVNG